MENFIQVTDNVAVFNGFKNLSGECSVHILLNGHSIIIHPQPNLDFMNVLHITIEDKRCSDPAFIKLVKDLNLCDREFKPFATAWWGSGRDI